MPGAFFEVTLTIAKMGISVIHLLYCVKATNLAIKLVRVLRGGHPITLYIGVAIKKCENL
jgi:hypothetical protein